MQTVEKTAPTGTDPARTIRQEILRLGDAVRERHGWLRHQDAIGFGIFAASSAAIVALAVAYARGALPALVVIPAAAFAMSLLHELEHDLIHRLYFKQTKWMHDLMMAGVWFFRPSTISPWVRQSLHLHHHKVSGSTSDLEERGITNGERWGLRRLLMTGDGMLALYLRPLTVYEMVHAYVDARKPANAEERRKLLWENRLAYLPLGVIHYTLWHAFVLYHAAAFVSGLSGHAFEPTGALATAVHLVDFLVVVWLAPNVLRTFCLHFVSSNLHYYGDIDSKNVVQQTQVWTKWWVFPLQMFCFNFGSTHAIHHFVVRDPFYVRQMIANDAHVVMKANGVRFDDYGTFLRANRWSARSEALGEVGASVVS